MHKSELCPKCGSQKLRRWADLTDDEKFIVARLPLSAEYGAKEREHHRFCIRCWNEVPVTESHRT